MIQYLFLRKTKNLISSSLKREVLRFNLVNGIPLTGIGGGHFNTAGYYSSYEESSRYSDGLYVPEWIEEQRREDPNGLCSSLKRHGFEVTDELLEILYQEISPCDWRRGQCGGCL